VIPKENLVLLPVFPVFRKHPSQKQTELSFHHHRIQSYQVAKVTKFFKSTAKKVPPALLTVVRAVFFGLRPILACRGKDMGLSSSPSTIYLSGASRWRN